MKSISYKDLQRVSFLSHLSQFDMMSADNDEVVGEALWEFGIDINFPLCYNVSYHRTLNKEAICGLMISGEIRQDKQFRLSPFCTLEDRMIIAGMKDLSLAHELAAIQNVAQSNYGSNMSLEDEEVTEHLMDASETERIEDELEALGNALNNIRGDQFLSNGARKRMKDYHMSEEFERVRKKKKNRSTLKHREMKREQV